MKIVTFNIRCDYDQDGKNSFRFRRGAILNKIQHEEPDIICFQEVLPHVSAWLKEQLSDYTIIGCGREVQLDGEETSIIYRKDRYNLINLEFFWLSDTPAVPGSRYQEQSECPRICSKAVFHQRETGEIFRVYNTHLDHMGEGARIKGIRQIIEDIQKENVFKKYPVIFAGDFNALPDSRELKLFHKVPDLMDGTKDLPGTFHDYGAVICPEKIDYIFVNSSVEVRKVELWEERDGIFLSDHYPIQLTIYL